MSKYKYPFPVADRTTSQQAQQLGEWTGESVPPLVAEIENHLSRSGAWYLLNRNEPAFNCEQAAQVRYCLGQNGIALNRELKSHLGYFIDEAGVAQKVAVHCRATATRDDAKVKNALQITGDFLKLEIVRDEDVESGGVYGLVNPFTLELASLHGDVTIQLFDQGVFTNDELPPTLMTNAGDRTWSVEFRASELGKVIASRRMLQADVVVNSEACKRPVFGIVTGNSPESGALLWDRFIKSVREYRRSARVVLAGDVYMPKVMLRSVPAMGMTMELHLREQQVWSEISRDIEEMCKELERPSVEQPNILAIACNTTPFFSDRIVEICDRYNVRFISIVDAIERYLDTNSIGEIVFLGIGYVHRPEFSGYSRLLNRPDIQVLPLSEEALSAIEELAFDVKDGRKLHECSQQLNNILKRNDLLGKNVIVALTELSLIVVNANWSKQRKTAGMLIDAVDVYASLLAEYFCSCDVVEKTLK